MFVKNSKCLMKFFMCAVIFIGLLTSCDGSSSDIDPVTTGDAVITFDNTKGTCTINVYNTPDRKSLIARIPAGMISGDIEWNSGFSGFFFSYQISLKDVPGSLISHVPVDSAKNQDYRDIESGKKTNILLPTLADTVSTPGGLLSNNSYLFIKNNFGFSVNLLLQGSAVLIPDNLSGNQINPGDLALFNVSDNRNVSDYQIRQTDYVSFPSSLTTFENGKVYYLVYNTNGIIDASDIKIIELKLDNISVFEPIFTENFDGNQILFTVVNDTQTNKWGFGANTPDGSLHSFHISNNGSENRYDIAKSSVVHIYSDIVFPVSPEPYTLYFDLRVQGENKKDGSHVDALLVQLAETSVIPKAGTRLPDNTRLGLYSMQGADWNKISISIPAFNAETTKRLVFTWSNDSSQGTQPPAAIDNIVIR